jgi:hypothetical protein
VEAAARGYGTDPHYDDFGDITPIQTLSVADCGFDLSEEGFQWFKKVKSYSFRYLNLY